MITWRSSRFRWIHAHVLGSFRFILLIFMALTSQYSRVNRRCWWFIPAVGAGFGGAWRRRHHINISKPHISGRQLGRAGGSRGGGTSTIAIVPRKLTDAVERRRVQSFKFSRAHSTRAPKLSRDVLRNEKRQTAEIRSRDLTKLFFSPR